MDMVSKGKASGLASTIPGGVGLGAALSLAITLIGACVSAWLIHKEIVDENAVGYCSLITLLLASSLGAVLAMNRTKRMRMQVCLLTGASYFLSLLCITALFFGGEYTGIGVTALAVLGGSGAVALMSIRQKKSRGHAHKKGAYR